MCIRDRYSCGAAYSTNIIYTVGYKLSTNYAMYKQKFFSFKRDRYYLLELTYNFAFQAVDYALFEPAYVAL